MSERAQVVLEARGVSKAYGAVKALDVVDIELQAIAGVVDPKFNVCPNNALTDGGDGNDVPYLANFPYLGTPHQGYDHRHDHGS